MQRWRRIWWWWLFAVALSFVALEATSIVFDQGGGAYTLSDTIRRWASWRPLAPLVCASCVFLLVHFFGQPNPPDG